jgi:SAM-dependent methyltransferase
MTPSPPCPTCNADQWEEIGQRTYRASAMDSGDEYLKRRLQVLFEIWCPGQTEVTLSSLLCGRCGFVIYSPRPNEQELDEKYRFLTSLGPDENTQVITSDDERMRAERLYSKLARRLPRQPSRVLDFGGADGRLMVPFSNRGHECFVVDYAPECVPGVTRLGTTLDDVPPSERFDAITCSHVVEHLADPFGVLESLCERLTDGGVIYIEVPMEIWRKPPLHDEPVTHVNFFTVESLRYLMARAGLTRLNVSLEGYRHPLGHNTVVVSGIGSRIDGRRDEISPQEFAAATRELLDPGLTSRVRRALTNPSGIPAALWQRIARAAPGRRR